MLRLIKNSCTHASTVVWQLDFEEEEGGVSFASIFLRTGTGRSLSILLKALSEKS